MPKPATYNWEAEDKDGICLTQFGAPNKPLTINGALAKYSNGVTSAVFSGNVVRTVGITSTSDLSAVNFTIKGFNQGQSVLRVIQGPTAGNTVYTSNTYFDVVTSIVPDANADDVSVGSGDSGYTYWFASSLFGLHSTTLSANVLSGVVDYTLQLTAEEDVNLPQLYLSDPVNMTGKTDSQFTQLSIAAFTFLRFELTATKGAVRFTVLQTLIAS